MTPVILFDQRGARVFMQTRAVHVTGPKGKQVISDIMKIARRLSQSRLKDDERAIVIEPLKQILYQLDLSLNGIERGAIQLIERISNDDDMIGIRAIDALYPRISFQIGMNAMKPCIVRNTVPTVPIP